MGMATSPMMNTWVRVYHTIAAVHPFLPASLLLPSSLPLAMYMPQSAVEGGELPEWAESEKAQFEEVLDKNKDGR